MTGAGSSHRHVVLRQDNGELAEDVVERARLEADDLDDAIACSFPASDATSSWAGADRFSRRRAQLAARVVHSAAVGEVPGRPHPGDAVPSTLPRTLPAAGVSPVARSLRRR